MAPLPIIACAQGFANGSFGGTGSLISQALAGGFASVAVQFSQTTPAQVSQIAGAGLTVIGWDGPLPASSLVNSFISAGMAEVSGQIENLSEYNAWYSFFQAGGAAGCIKSVMTDIGQNVFNGTGRWSALQALGVHIAYLETYADPAAGAHTDVVAWRDTAINGGIPAPELITMFGTYRGESPSSYTNTGGVGRGFALWDAEGIVISPSSYTTAFAGWAGLNGGPVLSGVPAPPPPSGGGGATFTLSGSLNLNNIVF